jgi:hypothetical protein
MKSQAEITIHQQDKEYLDLPEDRRGKEQSSEGTWSHQVWISRLLVHETKYFCFNSPGLWCFVMQPENANTDFDTE